MNLDNLGGRRGAQFLHPFSRSAPTFTDTELNNYFSMHHSETEKVHNTPDVWYILNKIHIYIYIYLFCSCGATLGFREENEVSE